MSDRTAVELALGLVAGAVLGSFFFGTLWLAIRRAPKASRPAFLVVASYLLRLSLLAVGMYGVVRVGGAASLLAALVGLLAVRHVMVQSIAPRNGPNPATHTPRKGA